MNLLLFFVFCFSHHLRTLNFYFYLFVFFEGPINRLLLRFWQKCSKAIVAGLTNVFVSLILCFMYCICFVYYTDNDQLKRISKDAI